jgi:hypothetical protein
MDAEYQRRLISADFELFKKNITESALDIEAEFVGGTVFVRTYGNAGHSEPYLAKIEPSRYPVGPWRVGFINPDAEGDQRLTVPDRDPRFWPYSQVPGVFGGFHVHYARPYRIFVCRPFTIEYFTFHSDQRWQPEVYNLPRVIMELDQEVKKAVHFSKWWGELYARVG